MKAIIAFMAVVIGLTCIVAGDILTAMFQVRQLWEGTFPAVYIFNKKR